MRTSTEIGSIASFVGEEKAIQMVAKAGFDCWDFSMFIMAIPDWGAMKTVKTGHPLENRDSALKFAERLRKIGEENGITCNQSHAPFPICIPDVAEYMPLAIECTAVAGGKVCVIHPDNNKSAEDNSAFYKELLPFAKKMGVRIVTENMWNWNHTEDHASFAACSEPVDFAKTIDLVNDPFLGACVDIGHAEMKGLNTTAPDMIKALGKRVYALHVHDNDKWHDSHEFPGFMNIDFEPVISALKEIGYAGDFTMEAGTGFTRYKDNLQAGVNELSNIARKFAERF